MIICDMKKMRESTKHFWKQYQNSEIVKSEKIIYIETDIYIFIYLHRYIPV